MTWAEIFSQHLKDAASDEDSDFVWDQRYKKEGNETPDTTMNARESCLDTRFSKGGTGNTSSWELGTGSGTGAIGHDPERQVQLEMAQVRGGRVLSCR